MYTFAPTSLLHYITRFYTITQYILVKNSIILARGGCVKPLKKSISITLDDPVLEKIKVLADQEDRSLSSYINLVLREHLERKKKDEV